MFKHRCKAEHSKNVKNYKKRKFTDFDFSQITGIKWMGSPSKTMGETQGFHNEAEINLREIIWK